jgi:hypothetical protein
LWQDAGAPRGASFFLGTNQAPQGLDEADSPPP